MLRLTPSAFWRMTPGEFFLATEGFLESRGIKPAERPLTRAEVAEAFAKYAPDR